MAARGGVVIGSSYDEARTRKMNADAQMAEMELLKAKGQYISVIDVQSAWQSVLANMKAKLLSMPSTVAPLVQSETNLGVVKDIIENSVRECLEELSSYEPGIEQRGIDGVESNDQAISGNTKTTAKANGQRVGRPRKKVVK